MATDWSMRPRQSGRYRISIGYTCKPAHNPLRAFLVLMNWLRATTEALSIGGAQSVTNLPV